MRPYGLQPVRLLCLWDSLGKNTGVGCLALSRGSSQPRDWACVFTTSTTWEAPYCRILLCICCLPCPLSFLKWIDVYVWVCVSVSVCIFMLLVIFEWIGNFPHIFSKFSIQSSTQSTTSRNLNIFIFLLVHIHLEYLYSPPIAAKCCPDKWNSAILEICFGFSPELDFLPLSFSRSWLEI